MPRAPRRRLAVAAALSAVLALAAWQYSFARETRPLEAAYAHAGSLGLCPDMRRFFPFLFLVRLLCFTFPLSLTPLLVYSGMGTTHYAVFHLVTLAVWAQALLARLGRGWRRHAAAD